MKRDFGIKESFSFNKKNVSRWRQVTSGLIIAVVLLASIGVANIVHQSDGSVYDTDYNNQYISGEEADWIVFTDGSSYYARNGSTGIIEFSNNTYLGGADEVIQYCIDELPDGIGGTVFLKAGTYYSDDTVELYRDYAGGWTEINLIGSGIGSTVLALVANSNCDIISFNVSGTSDDGFKSIKHMRLNGKLTDSSGSGIKILTSGSGKQYDVTVFDVFVARTKEYGIFHEDAWGARYTDVLTEYCGGTGFYLSGDQCYLTNIFSAYNGGDGFKLDGNRFFGTGLYSYINDEIGIYMKGIEHTFSNLKSKYSGTDGIQYHSGSYSTLANIIVSYWGGGGAWFGGLNIGGNYIKVSNGVIRGNGTSFSQYGIMQEGDHNSYSNIDIFDTNAESIWLNSAADDVRLDNVNYETIRNDATRSIINGISYNEGAPGSAGDWASETVEGVKVWDTSNSNLYVYVNSSWQQITLT